MPLRIGAWLSGQESQGHTVGPELSRMSPQSGFEGEGLWRQEKKVLRAEAGAGRQCVWVRQ